MDIAGRRGGLHNGRRRLESGAEALGVAMSMHHSCTGEHCDEVARLAGEVGKRLHLEPGQLAELELAGRLHDIGKIAVPNSILDKAGALTDDEWEVMRRHPVWGAEALQRTPGLEPVAVYVRLHHGRWDGNGYPDSLMGEQIPLLSRVLAACDAYSAMTEERPYGQALDRGTALAELRAGASEQFDPGVVAVLAELIEGEPAPVFLGRGEPALAA